MDAIDSKQATNSSQSPTTQNVIKLVDELRSVANKSPEHIAKQLSDLANSLENDLNSTNINH